MAAKCPKCGFSYAFDGATCAHCNPPPGSPDSAPPAEVVRVALLDRVLAAVLFAVIGAVFFGIIAMFVVGWEALKSVMAAAVFGGKGGLDPFAVYVVLGCIGLGLVTGAVSGWQVAARGRRRLRERPAQH